MSRRRILLIVVLIVVPLGVLATVATVPIVSAVRSVGVIVDRAHRGRDRLFLETNYEELLAACRALSKRAAAGELPRKQYFVCLGHRDPETLSFPQVILDLEPSSVIISAANHGMVWVVLMPGPDSFGVMAFPESGEGQGDVKLIDGLWYFDGDYSEESPTYRASIDAMIEEGRQSRAGRAAQPQGTQQK